MFRTAEWPYIVAAYAVTWVTLAGYAIHVMAGARRAGRAAATAAGGDQ